MKFFAVGLEPVGVIAIGGFARGGIAIGQGAVGIVAVGQLSTGMFTVGQLTVGLAVFGQLAISPFYAIGQLALGGIKGGGLVGISLKPSQDDAFWLLCIKVFLFIGLLILFWYATVLPLQDVFFPDEPRVLK